MVAKVTRLRGRKKQIKKKLSKDRMLKSAKFGDQRYMLFIKYLIKN